MLAAALALAAFLSQTGRSGTLEATRATAGPSVGLQPLVSGLGSITSITNARDARLFLTIQTGQIRIYSGGMVLSTPFLDLSSFVACCGERGLLSVAFHPQYVSNRYFFVYYTNVSGDIEIARYQRMAANANQADPSTRAVLLTIPHPTNSNHNGGQLQFGPDGYLYLGTGDGGSGNDPPCNAQNDAVALGKMLRIDVDQNVNVPPFYGVPASNPFAAQPFPRNITWAKGLRNPFRFSFDRLTGDFWIGDVGQGAREEIDFQPQSSAGGQNYGWKVMEGSLCGAGGRTNCIPLPPVCGDPSYTGPLYEYDHTLGSCSVIGGYVYRGSQDLNLYGVYVYGDLCTGNLWGNGQLLTPTLPGLQTFGEDVTGELYLGTGGGGLYHLTHPSPPPPPTPSALQFFTVTPCRVVDTRGPNGLSGGPPLPASSERGFVLAGQCGIPMTAKEVSINLTITQPNALGDLRLTAGGSPVPLISTVNFRPGQTRANNALVALGPVGEILVHSDQASGTVHVIIDVNGYFQ